MIEKFAVFLLHWPNRVVRLLERWIATTRWTGGDGTGSVELTRMASRRRGSQSANPPIRFGTLVALRFVEAIVKELRTTQPWPTWLAGVCILLAVYFAIIGFGRGWYSSIFKSLDAHSGTEQVEAGRGIVAEPPLIDLGEIEQGQLVSAKFKITNYTDKQYVVSRTSTSCPCLSIELQTRSC